MSNKTPRYADVIPAADEERELLFKIERRETIGEMYADNNGLDIDPIPLAFDQIGHYVNAERMKMSHIGDDINIGFEYNGAEFSVNVTRVE